jgi:hypothetical protein
MNIVLMLIKAYRSIVGFSTPHWGIQGRMAPPLERFFRKISAPFSWSSRVHLYSSWPIKLPGGNFCVGIIVFMKCTGGNKKEKDDEKTICSACIDSVFLRFNPGFMYKLVSKTR